MYLTAAMIFMAATFAAAAEPQIVRLWPNDPPATQTYDATDQLESRGDEFMLSNVLHPSLAVHLPATQPAEQPAAPRPAVIICPGGAYHRISVTREGTRIAEALNARGIVAFILRYRLPEGRAPADGELPIPQQDVLRAIQTVRHRADEWKVDPQRIGIIGFSAGGHLAASAATLFDQAPSIAGKANDDEISQESGRPDFAVLMYPVITMDAAITNSGSRRNLIGATPSADLIARFSADRQVTPDTPPLLIVTAQDDQAVPAGNSLAMAAAAAEHRVPCVLIMLKTGGHGFGIGQPDAESGQWFPLMLEWLKVRRVLGD